MNRLLFKFQMVTSAVKRGKHGNLIESNWGENGGDNFRKNGQRVRRTL